MAQFQMYTGSTQVLLNIYVKNISTSNGFTGLTAATAGLSCYYFVTGLTAPVQIPLVSVTLGTWLAGGFTEVDPVNCPGLYALGLPNVAWAGRLITVILSGVSGMAEAAVDIELTAINNQDALRGGILALPDGPTQLKRAQALNGFEFPMFSSVDGRTPLPGLTITSLVSKDGAAPVFTDNVATELVSPLFSGMYKINLTSADTNGATLTYFFTAPGAQSTIIGFITQP